MAADTKSLLAACGRLIAVEKSVMAMRPKRIRDWFMNKPGHRDCFLVARALQGRLQKELTNAR